MKTLEYTGTLVITSCWCGIKLAVPNDLYEYARRQSKAIFCPLGHEFVYGDAENDRLKRDLELAQQAVKYARASRDAAWDQEKAAQRTAAAYKGHLTRARKRIANGVCPVTGCHRHFSDVQAHIATKHPEYTLSEVLS